MQYIEDLNPSPFERIFNGTKTIEFRLFEADWKNMKVGDEVIFTKLPENVEKIRVQITDIYRKGNFDELFDFIGPSYFSGKQTKEEFIKVMSVHYTGEQREKYDALGLRFIVVES